jgi:uncharacterized RDD family membrane protein YckC
MIFCRRCGIYSAKGTLVCPRCQADLAAFGHDSMSGSAPRAHVTVPAAAGSMSTAVKAASSDYGSFVSRLLAVIIDGLLMTVATMIPIFLIMFVFVGVKPNPRSLMALGSTLLFLVVAFAVLLLLPIVYEVAMIANRGATYGKAYRKLIVVRTGGEPVSMGRSILRVLIKLFISQILLIGYLMALFTAKKQALHDLIADTVVMRQG